SALGQKQTWRPSIVMSAFPPNADIKLRFSHVRIVPEAELPPDASRDGIGSQRHFPYLTKVASRHALASSKSGTPNPSVNQSTTDASKSPAFPRSPWAIQSRARSVAARSSK